MDSKEYKKWADKVSEWIADYRDNVNKLPVRSNLKPGEVLALMPKSPPAEAEEFEKVFADFKEIVPNGITHWQHPRFFAYFPANSSLPSVLAEQLTAAIAANCMLWQTSPVGTEMEIRMLEWLAQLCGVPTDWKGVIQDSASSANLAAALTARERTLGWQGIKKGLFDQPKLRYYCSDHSHSSVFKAAGLSGVGQENAVKISVDEDGSMDIAVLEKAIKDDLAKGYNPSAIFAVVGATSSGMSDNLVTIGDIKTKYDLYGHVDAAWAGSATICEEHQHLIAGLDKWDSYVFNPHKWLGVNFDLSAHFLKDAQNQIKTLSATPDYLKTQHANSIVDFSNWTAPLGRRFRALKLWFVIRSYGANGLRKMIRSHISWAEQACADLAKEEDFEISCKQNLSMFLFRHTPQGMPEEQLDELNSKLLDTINSDGFLYLTQTNYNGQYVLRMQVGTTSTTQEDVQQSIQRIIELARK